MMMSRLRVMIPEELWAEILKRLPVKCLGKLQSVCKSWKSLISSSFFVTQHLEFMTGIKNNSNDYRFQLTGGFREVQQSFDLYNEATNSRILLEHPIRGEIRRINRLAVVHGVVFLQLRIRLADGIGYSGHMVCLWNPIIRKKVVIHWPNSGNLQLIGLGFDNRNLKLIGSRLTDSDWYEVYSPRIGDRMWRSRPLPRFLRSMYTWESVGCFLNGAIYWITAPKPLNVDNPRKMDIYPGPFALLRFDCVSEKFTLIDLPPQLVRDQYIVPKVFVLPGVGSSSLALVDSIEANKSGWLCELLTLQHDYGTWTKLARTHPIAAQQIFADWYTLTPVPPPSPDYHHARFHQANSLHHEYYPLDESLLLMDIGMPCVF